jgi:hypothetical protein
MGGAVISEWPSYQQRFLIAPSRRLLVPTRSYLKGRFYIFETGVGG